MAYLVTFDLTSANGSPADLTHFLDAILPDTRRYNGCLDAEHAVSEDTSDRVLLIEKWNSRPAFDACLSWRVDRGDFARLRGQLATGPIVPHFSQS